jgi:hypothetical protein
MCPVAQKLGIKTVKKAIRRSETCYPILWKIRLRFFNAIIFSHRGTSAAFLHTGRAACPPSDAQGTRAIV